MSNLNYMRYFWTNVPPFNCSVDFFNATLTSAYFTSGYEWRTSSSLQDCNTHKYAAAEVKLLQKKRSSFARSLKEDTFIAESCIKEWSELEGQIYLSHFVKDWLNKLLTKTYGVPIQHLPTLTP